jgi:hypothetical protein
MKKKINFILLALLIFFTNTQTSYAADNNGLGDAAVLKITMRKVELCTGYQGGDFDDILTDAFCNDALVIGTGDKEIDIASVDAGSVAGSYGNSTLLPLGETYTHLRVTMDRKITMKTKSPIDTTSTSGDTDFCITKTTTDAMYGGGSGEAGKKYTHRTAINQEENGTAEEMNLYFVDGRGQTQEDAEGNSTYRDGSGIGAAGRTYEQCYGNNCGASLENWSWTYAELASHLQGKENEFVAMSIPRFSKSTDDLVLVYKIFKPYTIKTTPPTLNIAFSTKNNILAFEASASGGSETASNNDGKCGFTIGEVLVQISMKDAKEAGPSRVKGDIR